MPLLDLARIGRFVCSVARTIERPRWPLASATVHAASAALVAALVSATVFTSPAAAQTGIKFSLDGRLEGPAALVPRPPGPGLLQGRGARRHHRRGGDAARADHPGRFRRLRHGLRRHQRAHQVSRPEPVGADQGGVHGLQQAALRDRRRARAAASPSPSSSKARSSARRPPAPRSRSGRCSPSSTASTCRR